MRVLLGATAGARQQDFPMAEQQSLFADAGAADASLTLAAFAQRAYLDYAVSVVKGRALPDVCDGQKPVQRRILYAMNEMGLAANAKPVKSARVVGDVLGKFHPHGDSAAYDALVRMAQGFSLRYPLIDGQGNFGSRDGDGAAAMRYTEARLTPIARLLLDELDEGTVDFGPVVGALQVALKNPQAGVDELMAELPGPDFPGGGQIISAAADIRECYCSGRGSLKARARYRFEDLARGQWQLVVTELPPGASSQRVLEEIEELTNPKVRAGKKSLTPEQQQTKALVLSVLDSVRDESGKEAAVRLVFEPRTSKVDRGGRRRCRRSFMNGSTSGPRRCGAARSTGSPGCRTAFTFWKAAGRSCSTSTR